MDKPIPFQTVLEALCDESKPFSPRYLHHFSDLTPDQIQAFTEAWPKVPLIRKRAFLEDLEELAELDTLVFFDDLARPLIHDDDPQVRASAIRLLWECEDTSLIPILLEMLEHDSDPQVRATAATALGQFVYLGEVEEIPSALHHQVEDHLLRVVQDANDEIIVRRRVLEALGTSSRPEVPSLIENAYAEPNPAWKVSALFAMGRSGDTCWEKQVLSNLRATSQEIRLEAVRAAGELELSSARAQLLDALEDEEDLEIRREIIWALSKIGGEGVRERLEELLDTEEDDEEADFLETALDNLAFTEDSLIFDMFSFEEADDSEENEDETWLNSN